MEVCVQSNDDAPFPASHFDDGDILSLGTCRVRSRAVRPSQPPATDPPPCAANPGRARPRSCCFEFDYAVIQIARREIHRLTNILRIEFGVLSKQLIPIRIQGHGLDNAFDGEAHATNAGLPVHYRGVDGDAIKAINF